MAMSDTWFESQFVVCPRCRRASDTLDDGSVLWGTCTTCRCRWPIASWARSSTEWEDRRTDPVYVAECLTVDAYLNDLRELEMDEW